MVRWAGKLTQRRAARILKVHQVHLNLVLRGKRPSRRLTRRYQELLEKHTREELSKGGGR